MLCKRRQVTVARQGLRIQTRIGDGEGLFCAVAGTAYESEMDWFLNQMSAGQIFIDVGANIGIYSLHASRRLNTSGKVYAFEPTPATFEALTRNVQLNRITNVECHKMALAERSGMLSLVVGNRPASNSTSKVTGSSESGITIPATTLDEFCETHSVAEVDFIKVDIEGGEFAFFKGGMRTLHKHKSTILFESMHSGPSYPERDLLRELGYKLYFLKNNSLKELSADSTFGANIIAMAYKK